MTIQEEHNQMVKQLAKSGESILASITPTQMHRLHMAVGIAGEVGEILEVIKDAGIGVISEDEAKNCLIEEYGDFMFYVRGYAQTIPNLELEVFTLPRSFKEPEETFIVCGLLASCDLLDATKREAIYQKSDATNETKILKSLTNTYIYIKEVMKYMEITEEMALEHNLNKLLKGKNARYASGSYSDQQANDRADKQ